MSHNAILVTRMLLATIALLCKQTFENFRARPPPLGNRLLFVPHWFMMASDEKQTHRYTCDWIESSTIVGIKCHHIIIKTIHNTVIPMEEITI